jgi:protein phosphatase
MTTKTTFKIAFAADCGPRESYEDCSFAISYQKHAPCPVNIHICGVADGVGGESFGEAASGLVARELPRALIDRITRALQLKGVLEHDDLNEIVLRSIEAVNDAVVHLSSLSPSFHRSSTTLTSMVVCGDHAVIANVGDSPAWLYRNGRLIPLTRAHTVAQEMIDAGLLNASELRNGPDGHCLTRCLGSPSHWHPDLLPLSLQDGDQVVISSDGLCDVVSNPVIGAILNRAQSAADAAKELVQAALERDTTDNTTVLVVDVVGNSSPKFQMHHKTLTADYLPALAKVVAPQTSLLEVRHHEVTSDNTKSQLAA